MPINGRKIDATVSCLVRLRHYVGDATMRLMMTLTTPKPITAKPLGCAAAGGAGQGTGVGGSANAVSAVVQLSVMIGPQGAIEARTGMMD